MAAQAGIVSHMLAEAEAYKGSMNRAGMACVASFAGKGVDRRQRSTGVGFRVALNGIAKQPQKRQRRNGRHEDSTKQAPRPPLLKVVQVVPLPKTLSCAFASGHSS